MLYIATNPSLPLKGLRVFAQGDSRMVDFNLTLGHLVVKMKFEDLDNLYTDLEFKGSFVGVIAHF